MSDVNKGSMILFRRGMGAGGAPYGDWEIGYVTGTLFTDGLRGPVVEPSFDHPDYQCWVEILPAVPEGEMAPTTLSLPLDMGHIDPVVHGCEVGV